MENSVEHLHQRAPDFITALTLAQKGSMARAGCPAILTCRAVILVYMMFFLSG